MKKRQRKKNLYSNKTITLQLRDFDGETIESNQITLSNSDTLIMEFNPEIINMEMAHKAFSNIHKSLTKRAKMIGYPKGITLKVLQIE